MPVPTLHVPTPTADQVERFVNGIESRVGVGTSLIPEIEEAASIAAPEAEVVAAAGTATFGGWELAVVEGTVELIILVLLLVIVLAIRVIRWFEQIDLWLAGKIPFAGQKVQAGIRVLFRIIDPLENAIAKSCADAAIGMINGTINTFYWLMHYFGLEPIPRTSNQGGTASDLRTLQGEVVQLQAQVKYLTSHLGSVEYITSNGPATVGVPQNLWEQLHNVESAIHALQSHAVSTDNRIAISDRAITQLEHQVSNLTQNVHDVRAVSTGWQDVEHAIAQIQTELTHFVNATTAATQRTAARVSMLEPLGVLVTAGPAGLKVLRQLEDTPCMCPKLPNLPTLSAEWLATYEFLSHG